MNKNTLFLAILFAINLCSWKAIGANWDSSPIFLINKEYTVPTGYDEIRLYGKLDVSIGPNAVVAGANENSVYIGFNQDFGNVSITIYNGAGLVVYSTVVDTSVQQVVIIPITTAASGTYTVVLDNANGYAEGDFERN